MKILLLTDIPPDRSLTAGLVLDRVCRFLPTNSVSCFAVVNPVVSTKLSEDLHGVPTMFVDKPREDGLSEFGKRGSMIRNLAERVRGVHDRNFAIPKLVAQAARFGRQQKVDAVWVVLQGQTMIHMARPLARKLGVPLFTLVWDPLSWWLRSFEVEPHTSKLANREFDRAIASSRAVATASWAMTAAYDKKYRVFSVPVIASHDRAVAQQPAPHIHTGGELVIGMAGQFYARSEWDQLVAALNACKWKIGGRHVRINVAGHHLPETDAPAGKITKLGWLAHPELVKRLSECDILYCPYPYDKEMDEVSRLSFPSKLVAYLAAGRPTVFHGPKDAAPGQYIAETGAGLVALGPQASAIYNVIERLTLDAALFERCATNAQQAFLRDFTFETMKKNFFQFLRLDEPGSSLSLSKAEHDFHLESPGSAAVLTSTSRIVDKRNPRLRNKRLKIKGRAGVGWKLKLLRRARYVRNLEARAAELANWQDVHSKELTGLYDYVKYLNEEIGRHKAASDQQLTQSAADLRIRSDQFDLERDQLRSHISLRDESEIALVKTIETQRVGLAVASEEVILLRSQGRDLRARFQVMSREWEGANAAAVAEALAAKRDRISLLSEHRSILAKLREMIETGQGPAEIDRALTVFMLRDDRSLEDGGGLGEQAAADGKAEGPIFSSQSAQVNVGQTDSQIGKLEGLLREALAHRQKLEDDLQTVRSRAGEMETVTHQIRGERDAAIASGQKANARMAELERVLVDATAHRQKLETDFDNALARIADAEDAARRALTDRDVIAAQGHEEALALQLRQVELEAQVNALTYNSTITHQNGEAVEQLRSELAEARGIAGRSTKLLEELQIARAIAEERAAAIIVLQDERAELARSYDALIATSERERDVEARKSEDLEQRLSQKSMALAEVDVLKAVLAEKDGHLARVSGDRDRLMSLISSDSTNLNLAAAAMEKSRLDSQRQVLWLLRALIEADGNNPPTNANADFLARKLYLEALADHLATGDASSAEPLEPKNGKSVLEAIRALVEKAIKENVAGEFLDVGSARNAGAVYMASILATHQASRKVWASTSQSADRAADNVITYPADRIGGGDTERSKRGPRIRPALEITAGEISLLDSSSEDGFALAGAKSFAVIHLHADEWRSLDLLRHLLPRLSTGGSFFISTGNGVDVHDAMNELRDQHDIRHEIHEVDGVGLFWTNAQVKNVRSRSRTQPSSGSKPVRRTQAGKRSRPSS